MVSFECLTSLESPSQVSNMFCRPAHLGLLMEYAEGVRTTIVNDAFESYRKLCLYVPGCSPMPPGLEDVTYLLCPELRR